jgi:arylsulfatase A-like enzyme
MLAEVSVLSPAGRSRYPHDRDCTHSPEPGFTRPWMSSAEFRRATKGTCREGGARVPALAWGPGIKAGSRSADIVGGLDYMATFASLTGVKLPENDREGKPTIFDSYDMPPLLFGKGRCARKSRFYFTENELTPAQSGSPGSRRCST